MTVRSVDYYRRIVALGRAHNVKIGFYYLPRMLSRESRSDEISELSAALGAPVYILPYAYTRVSYHHYKDLVHSTPAFRPVYSTWFASLIDEVGAN